MATSVSRGRPFFVSAGVQGQKIGQVALLAPRITREVCSTMGPRRASGVGGARDEPEALRVRSSRDSPVWYSRHQEDDRFSISWRDGGRASGSFKGGPALAHHRRLSRRSCRSVLIRRARVVGRCRSADIALRWQRDAHCRSSPISCTHGRHVAFRRRRARRRGDSRVAAGPQRSPSPWSTLPLRSPCRAAAANPAYSAPSCRSSD